MTNTLGRHYPWNSDSWELLQRYYTQARVPTSLLLSGPTGIGKKDLAKFFASLLLCHKPHNNIACGSCASCNLMATGGHIDYNYVEVEEGSNILKIEQIRELRSLLFQAPADSNYKVAVINDADCMQESAANSLLKTLEEPMGKTILILLSSKPWQLPLTIRSRCSHIKLSPASLAQAEAWLELNQAASSISDLKLRYNFASGGPLEISSSSTDNYFVRVCNRIKHSILSNNCQITDFITSLSELDLIDVVRASLIILQDIIKIRTVTSCSDCVYIQENELDIILEKNYNLFSLYEIYDYHIQLLREIDSGTVWQKNSFILSLHQKWQELL
ncbi:MAG: DNA polymerase III subunit [Pseudomonadota bacterium]|nr:DNA polymerase III subunit [Pseudomonadota bacterium]